MVPERTKGSGDRPGGVEGSACRLLACPAQPPFARSGRCKSGGHPAAIRSRAWHDAIRLIGGRPESWKRIITGMKRSSAVLPVVLAATLSGASGASAQVVSHRLYVSVIDGAARPVGGLTSADFSVSEGGAQREIT